MKLPIWTVGNGQYVTVRPGFAIHEQEYAYAGRTRCSNPLNTWVRGLPPRTDNPVKDHLSVDLDDWSKNLVKSIIKDGYWTKP